MKKKKKLPEFRTYTDNIDELIEWLKDMKRKGYEKYDIFARYEEFGDGDIIDHYLIRPQAKTPQGR